MKKFSPYVSVGLVLSMFYILYQLQKTSSTLSKFGEVLHNNSVLLLFSVCALLAVGLSVSGFKNKSVDNGLKTVSYFGFFGAIVIVLIVWIFPFFV